MFKKFQKLSTREKILGLVLIVLLGVAASGPLIQTTAFTRILLEAVDSGTARGLLGVSTTAANATNQYLFTPQVLGENTTNSTNQFSYTFNLTANNPTNIGGWSTGGIQNNGTNNGGWSTGGNFTNPTNNYQQSTGGNFSNPTNNYQQSTGGNFSNPTNFSSWTTNILDMWPSPGNGINIRRSTTSQLAWLRWFGGAGDAQGPSHYFGQSFDALVGLAAQNPPQAGAAGDFFALAFDSQSQKDLIGIGLVWYNLGMMFFGPQSGNADNAEFQFNDYPVTGGIITSNNIPTYGLEANSWSNSFIARSQSTYSDGHSILRGALNQGRWFDLHQGSGTQDIRFGWEPNDYTFFIESAAGNNSGPQQPGERLFWAGPGTAGVTNANFTVAGTETVQSNLNILGLYPSMMLGTPMNAGLLANISFVENGGTNVGSYSPWSAVPGFLSAPLGSAVIWTNVPVGSGVLFTNPPTSPNGFQGAANEIRVPGLTNFAQISNSMTVMLLFNQPFIAAGGNYSADISYIASGNTLGFNLYHAFGGNMTWQIVNSAATTTTLTFGAGFLMDTNWHVLTLELSPSAATAYVDLATNLGTTAFSGNLTNLFKSTGTPELEFGGMYPFGAVGQCRVWGRTLSTNEIKLNYWQYFPH